MESTVPSYIALTLPNLPQDIVSLDLCGRITLRRNYVMQNILVFNCHISRNISNRSEANAAVIKYIILHEQDKNYRARCCKFQNSAHVRNEK